MKRILSLVLVLSLIICLVPSSFAASSEAIEAANILHDLGLFSGVGTNPDGTPNYDLDRVMTRAEAVTMLVRLLGKDQEAKNKKWNTPFLDVPEWAKPYVGYAYENKLTSGVSSTSYGSSSNITATQYISFVLSALGYSNGIDFKWNEAWVLSDGIGLTKGQYKDNSYFTRGDAVIISYHALSCNLKSSEKRLIEVLDSGRLHLGDKIITNFVELTFDNWGISESIEPNNKGIVYSYKIANENEALLYLVGTAKNTSTDTYDFTNSKAVILLNGKYNYSAEVFLDVGNSNFYTDTIKPLQTVFFYIAASIPKEALESLNSAQFSIGFNECFPYRNKYINVDISSFAYQYTISVPDSFLDLFS